MRLYSFTDGPLPFLCKRHWDKVTYEPNSGCWLWLGAVTKRGEYGIVRDHGELTVAHRFFYAAYKGHIPGGLILDHLCRVRCCVNPDHVEPVTSAENTHRGLPTKRTAAHCGHGHPRTPANTYYRSNGYTECSVCHRAASTRYNTRVSGKCK